MNQTTQTTGEQIAQQLTTEKSKQLRQTPDKLFFFQRDNGNDHRGEP